MVPAGVVVVGTVVPAGVVADVGCGVAGGIAGMAAVTAFCCDAAGAAGNAGVGLDGNKFASGDGWPVCCGWYTRK